MMVIFIRAGRHVATAFQTEISNDRELLFRLANNLLCPHTAKTPGGCSHQFADFFGMCRADGRRPQRVGELHFMELMIAP